MYAKDGGGSIGISSSSSTSPSSSNRSSTSSSNSSSASYSNSSGYLSGTGPMNNNLSPLGGYGGRLSRLSGGQSSESGVSSISSSRYSYLSGGGSSSSQNSLDRLEEVGQSGLHGATDHFQKGLKETEILYAWLDDLALVEFYPRFVQAGYDLPTISRMTPEDLTAVGITQPAVRKRLTAEISRLNIHDGIPNHRPSSLLDWLRCLRLELYHEILAKEGYEDFDRITDIIWEDLEEIGIRKLGHQKKIMLAIDRLKKLNLSSRRLSSLDQHVGSDDPSVPSTGAHSPVVKVSSTSSFGASWYNSDPSPPLRLQRSTSGENVNSDRGGGGGLRMGDSSGMVPLRPPLLSSTLAPQPELVIIQVNQGARSWTGSVADDADSSASMKYESFYGNPLQDFHCLRKEADGEVTPTNEKGAVSSDETESPSIKFRPQLAPKPKVNCRARRASGGSVLYSEMDLGADAFTWNRHVFDKKDGATLDNSADGTKSGAEVSRPASAGCYRSAPNTPAHSSSHGRPRKPVPPPPPKRTNSVKAEDSSKLDSESFAESEPTSPITKKKKVPTATLR